MPGLVSIGVPVYNGERSIERILASILGQTYPHLEVVVCDNGSSDRTGAICQAVAARDPRVKYHRNPTNIGLIGNFRRVLELSTGDYFAWNPADDVRPAEAVARSVRVFEAHPDTVMVHGPIRLDVRDGGELEIANDMDLSHRDPAVRVRAFTRGLQHNGMLFSLHRRDAIRHASYGRTYGADYLVCLTMCVAGPIRRIETPVITYHHRFGPVDNPMYAPERLLVRELLTHRSFRRRKCWTVLVVGVWYLLRYPSSDRGTSLRAAVAHVAAFTSRYRQHLRRELVFMLASPVAWLVSGLVPAARRFKRRRDVPRGVTPGGG